jgi:hypothetical protein
MAEGWILYTLSAAVIGLRVYTQLKITRQFGIGDVVMIAALVGMAQKQSLLSLTLTDVWNSSIDNADCSLFQRLGKTLLLPG